MPYTPVIIEVKNKTSYALSLLRGAWPVWEDLEPVEQAGYIHSIMERADGCFLWVRLVIEELAPVHAKEILQSVPAGMDKLYTTIIANVAESLRPVDRSVVQASFFFILNPVYRLLYRSCVFEQKILVTGLFFRTALGNKFLCTEHSRVTCRVFVKLIMVMYLQN